ncbi:MAG: hypothetical protein JO217_01940, partial [Acidobacteriaceae bacterium]|nr:hypothetical protein [Acidobacteriaceae bacterium]
MAQTVTDPIYRQADLEQQSYQSDGIICALLMTACLLLGRPFLDMGFVDDWSYIKTAQVFAETGHFAYNGWGAVTVGWQALWGALFVKLLGFSFIHVRLSMLPVSIASVYLFHQILIRFEISRANALFGTLVLGLSPVFMAMAASFLTDLPGLFSTLLCLYLCQRTLAARTDPTALAWLSVAIVSNVASGTARQTGWLGVLVMVPSTLWLLRSRRGLFWMGGLLWVASVGAVFLTMHWFYQQPYFIEINSPHHFGRTAIKQFLLRNADQGPKAFLCLLLLVLPVLAVWLPLARSMSRRRFAWLSLTAVVLLIGALLYAGTHGKLNTWLAPWLLHVIGYMGTPGAGNIPGWHAAPFGYWQRIPITAFVIGSALIFFLDLFQRLALRAQESKISAKLPWRQILWLIVPYTIGYMGALSMAAALIFDRYLLAAQAVAIILLLGYYQDFVTPQINPLGSRSVIGRIPLVSWLVLFLFTCYSVAGIHDWFALDRARLDAAQEVRRSGVPRVAIAGGFEYDAWTQLEVGGYINNEGIKNPPDAYHQVPYPKDL